MLPCRPLKPQVAIFGTVVDAIVRGQAKSEVFSPNGVGNGFTARKIRGATVMAIVNEL